MAGDNPNKKEGWGTGIEILDRPSQKTKRPPMYTVLVHNDPFTPREFVVAVIMQFFGKTREQALRVMMTAHTQGQGAAGTYTKEIAETKASTVIAYCRSEGRPLQFSVQEE